ncbi:leucine-rich repeat domain-containing protein [Ruminococcaceae bacterium OttesenSCG-928-I18]|nr:leucine-rich repeat domain-containing protein [Ruminococcaceae bacterium OttesenSCG-928-I18]
MKKSMVAIGLVLVFSLSLLCGCAGDGTLEDGPSQEGDFVVNDGSLTRYKGKGNEIVVPNSVTKIAQEAFAGLEIKSIVVPASVTEISYRAFENCRQLESVVIEGQLTELMHETFKNCESLQSVQLPDTLQTIGTGCFEKCGALSQAPLPASLTEIGDQAFWQCDLREVTIPNGVAYVGKSAFSTNEQLEKVVLENPETVLGSGAFSGCTALRECELSEQTVVFWNVFEGCENLPNAQNPEAAEFGEGGEGESPLYASVGNIRFNEEGQLLVTVTCNKTNVTMTATGTNLGEMDMTSLNLPVVATVNVGGGELQYAAVNIQVQQEDAAACYGFTFATEELPQSITLTVGTESVQVDPDTWRPK